MKNDPRIAAAQQAASPIGTSPAAADCEDPNSVLKEAMDIVRAGGEIRLTAIVAGKAFGARDIYRDLFSFLTPAG